MQTSYKARLHNLEDLKTSSFEEGKRYMLRHEFEQEARYYQAARVHPVNHTKSVGYQTMA